MVPPVPSRTPLVQGLMWLMQARWIQWLTALVAAVNLSVQLVAAASLDTQGAAIATTAIPSGPLPAGLYRVSYTARISRAATTSSSLTVTVSWTDGGIALSQAAAALVGNTTASQQNGALLVHVDGETTISYAAAYASVGATSMQFALRVVLERVREDEA